MAATDRNVLRLGAYELLHSDTPARVAIDEAVELAKRFGSAQSAQFVNGILDKVMHEKEEVASGQWRVASDESQLASLLIPFIHYPLSTSHYTMGLFDKFKQGLKKTTQLLNTDIRDLFKAQGRLVDESFLDELFETLVKTDMGVEAAQEIADEIGDDVPRPGRRRCRKSSTRSRASSRRCWPSRPSRSASPPAGRRSSWWPASTAAARPPRSPSWPACSRPTARGWSSARPTRFGPRPSSS